MEDPVLLSVAVDPGRLDDIGGRAWLAGATGIAEEHVADRDQVRLLVSCAPADQAAVAAALGGDATRVDSWTPVVRRVTVEVEGRALDLEVPANVFGDGAHPTTATCLALVSDLVGPGMAVLDLGCGAGLLTVAAALRGASVTALDIWGPAVAATTANVAIAGIAERVQVIERSIEPDDHADVVFANIGAATLAELAPLVLAATEGPIVLSGLLDHQADEVAASFAPRPVVSRVVDGWATLTVGPLGSVRPAGS